MLYSVHGGGCDPALAAAAEAARLPAAPGALLTPPEAKRDEEA
jgi:hypothetical protein